MGMAMTRSSHCDGCFEWATPMTYAYAMAITLWLAMSVPLPYVAYSLWHMLWR